MNQALVLKAFHFLHLLRHAVNMKLDKFQAVNVMVIKRDCKSKLTLRTEIVWQVHEVPM